jgi:AraC family transcriptional regulator
MRRLKVIVEASICVALLHIGLNKLATMDSAQFALYVWTQRLLVVAPAYVAATHRHHAAQIVLGLNGPAVFSSPETGLHTADLILIHPDTSHAHPAFGPSATLYLEPESNEWTYFHGRAGSGVVALSCSLDLQAFARGAVVGDMEAARALVDNLLGHKSDRNCNTDRNSNEDALVAQVRTLIGERLDGPITLAALAKAVHKSPSRLAHRFREETGVPLRRYVLWRRLRAAVEFAMRGARLTEAAHLAGFADSAHLSRTFRAMFGIAPSELFDKSRLSVTFCEA